MNKRELMDAYYRMQLARSFETRVAEQYTKGRIGGFCHLYSGEEAVAVGALAHLRNEDYVIGSYRDHAYYLIRGGDPRRAMAELFGHADGCCKGKGGSMHLFDQDINFFGGYAIVAGMCPIAVGLGLSVKNKQENRVVLCFFGDGATNQGVYHEALNMSSLYQLPIVWVCENNVYAIGTSVSRSSAEKSLARKARRLQHADRRRQRDGFLQDAFRGRARHRARARRPRASFHRGEMLPFPRAFHVRPGHLPVARRGGALEEARPDPQAQGGDPARLRGDGGGVRGGG